MDSGNFLPPTHLPKNIMQNYAAAQRGDVHHAEQLDDVPEEEVPKTFIMENGGKVLAALIAVSAVIFLILFYDSIHIESKLAAVTPDKLQLLLDHLKVPN